MTERTWADAFWDWECDVQDWWVRLVVDLAQVYGTPDDVVRRMWGLGFSVLLVLTWPQALVRRVQFLVWCARGRP